MFYCFFYHIFKKLDFEHVGRIGGIGGKEKGWIEFTEDFDIENFS